MSTSVRQISPCNSISNFPKPQLQNSNVNLLRFDLPCISRKNNRTMTHSLNNSPRFSTSYFWRLQDSRSERPPKTPWPSSWLSLLIAPKGQSILISDALYAVLREEEPWQKNELEDFSTTNNKSTATSADIKVKCTAQKSFFDKTETASTETWTKNEKLWNHIKVYRSDNEWFHSLTQDNFGRKFISLEKMCYQAELSDRYRQRAFSVMLCGEVKHFYPDTLRSQKLSLDQLVTKTKNGSTHRSTLLRDYESGNACRLLPSSRRMQHALHRDTSRK